MRGQGLVEFALVLVLIAVVVIALVSLFIGMSNETDENGWSTVEGTEAVKYKHVIIRGQQCILVTRSGWESIGIHCN